MPSFFRLTTVVLLAAFTGLTSQTMAADGYGDLTGRVFDRTTGRQFGRCVIFLNLRQQFRNVTVKDKAAGEIAIAVGSHCLRG